METKNNQWVRSIFFFDSMLMPKIIAFIYWLLLLGVLLGGIGMIFSGDILRGLGTWIFGAVGARLWCELMIVMFKINENIQKLADK